MDCLVKQMVLRSVYVAHVEQVRFMKRFRSLLSLLLVVVSVFLVSCGSAPVAKAPDYTPAKIEAIERYTTDIAAMRDRMTSELPKFIQSGEWVDVGALIHGPLGELRTKMISLSRNLTPDLQKKSQAEAKDLFEHLVKLDEAAQAGDLNKAVTNYRAAIDDISAFFDVVPEFSSGSSS